jgi:glycerol-3-phosphate dehydrogenase
MHGGSGAPMAPACATFSYMMANEWAQTEDDVLWRRSKLGLRMSRHDRARLAAVMTDAVGSAAPTGADGSSNR